MKMKPKRKGGRRKRTERRGKRKKGRRKKERKQRGDRGRRKRVIEIQDGWRSNRLDRWRQWIY